MENKNFYTHKEVKEMFEAYRNLELAISIHHNSENFNEYNEDVRKYSEIARDKIPEEIQRNELGYVFD